jgi:hypothetical protein
MYKQQLTTTTVWRSKREALTLSGMSAKLSSRPQSPSSSLA